MPENKWYQIVSYHIEKKQSAMCVGLSYLVKFTYLSSLKNINVDDVIEGLWTNDFVFVFIHR